MSAKKSITTRPQSPLPGAISLPLARIAGILGSDQGETNHLDLASVGFIHLERNLALLELAVRDCRELVKQGNPQAADLRLTMLAIGLESSKQTALYLSELFDGEAAALAQVEAAS